MTDSVTDSGHDTTSTFETSETSGPPPPLPLGRGPNPVKLHQSENDILPKLPSHKFRYSVWHDLRQTCLTGDQLHAPRVRAGPPEKDQQFYKIHEEGLPIHHDIEGRARMNHMCQFENWENTQTVNLCYQELFDKYQRSNFNRILSRCVSAKIINLSHNTMVHFGKIRFPSCEYLNVNNNYIKGFYAFPYLPNVRSITARNNAIKDTSGIGKLAKTPLEELDLKGNPICFTLNYRQIMFACLPNLTVLDGIPKMPCDLQVEVEANSNEGKGCVLM